ncbi:hypothetical protein ACTJJ0_32155 [Chitinophaga sp. 22321]|uniref:Lipoprotein n=1 Tax=Chitinophaga hostae TaxID=2831022 RepID=A0ABS5IXR2_9BACT|nr:hypothetical protein [Chitinophaga hostae]MBS0027628.1 hypothetical protein [Chitinophaga hostae]
MRHFLLRAITGSCLLFITWGLLSCSKEKTLSPNDPPVFYNLPQGNHPYDDSIVAFNKKYGSYILYKFTQQDFAYDLTSYVPMIAANANQAYVQQTLTFFRTQCLDLYPETFLRKTMPFRIVLAAYLDTIISSLGKPVDTSRSLTGFTASHNMIAIGWADSTLQQHSPQELRQVKAYLNRCYFQQALLSGALIIPDVFMRLGPAGGYQYVTGFQPEKGMLEAPSSEDAGRNASATWDFLCYINAITGHTKAELDATILSPSVDRNGKIQEKYDALVRYFKTQYGVDLQAVGDHR